MLNKQQRESLLFCFCGPAGSGKSTIVNGLIEQKSLSDIQLSISTTTRSPRSHEKDGVHYHFVSNQEFDTRKVKGSFLEFAVYNGNQYGTEKDSIDKLLNSGIDVLFDIEVQGVQQLKTLYGNRVVVVFVFPPSFTVLKERLENRGTESKEIIVQRLVRAKEEIKILSANDFSNYILFNQTLEKSIEVAKSIIIAERNRFSYYQKPFLDKILL